ncbi:MAG: C40 family peptidase [Desulfovibrionaceae bacterium]|nr:C40 family peptidase [Desulfovibrionaceae bacterium]MBF0514726.1 C40 family peptidase [Desulfovibrionaceae bacterium]
MNDSNQEPQPRPARAELAAASSAGPGRPRSDSPRPNAGFSGQARAASRLAAVLALTLALAACSLLNTSSVDKPSRSAPANKIVETAKSQIGKPYRNAGESPKTGFDCSGLVQWTYAQYGINLPRKTADQYQAGKSVPKSALSPGDLVFFQIGSRRYDSMHVGIYSGGGEFIHSPSPGGRVREEPLNSPYWESYYLGAKRVTQ